MIFADAVVRGQALSRGGMPWDWAGGDFHAKEGHC